MTTILIFLVGLFLSPLLSYCWCRKQGIYLDFSELVTSGITFAFWFIIAKLLSFFLNNIFRFLWLESGLYK